MGELIDAFGEVIFDFRHGIVFWAMQRCLLTKDATDRK
jgi:hypothetical protein